MIESSQGGADLSFNYIEYCTLSEQRGCSAFAQTTYKCINGRGQPCI